MRIKKYVAESTKDALLQIREELGPQAVILKTKKIPGKSIMGILGKSRVEVTAALDEKLFVEPEPTVSKEKKTNSLTNLHLYNRNGQKTSQQSHNTEKSNGFTDEKFRLAEIHEDVEEVKSVLRNLANHIQYQEMPPFPEKIVELCSTLIDNEVKRERAINIGLKLQAIFSQENMEDIKDNNITEKAIELLASGIKASGPFTLNKKRATRVMFVGPTGAGKTTTLAKLAAQYGILQKMRVRMITADTYRIAAIEQLKTFAEIADIPMEVVFTPEEIRRMVTRMASSSDLVLIDTAGRSQHNKEHMDDIKHMVEAAQPDELHLVMSSTTKQSDLRDTMDRYRLLGVNRILFTKLDETAKYGTLYNLLAEDKVPFSYVTTGQSVPDDIEEGKTMKLAQMLLGKTLKIGN